MSTSAELAIRDPILGESLGLKRSTTGFDWKGGHYSLSRMDAVAGLVVDMLWEKIPKDREGSVKPYVVWLIETGTHPLEVRLREFAQDKRDEWIEDNPDDPDGLNNTIRGWCTRVKAVYRNLMQADREFLALKHGMASHISPEDPRYFIDWLEALMNVGMTEPIGILSVITEEDDPTRPRWLTVKQMTILLKLIYNAETAIALRNKAWIGLSTATALRRAELADIRVNDLRQTKKGQLGLFVRNPKRTSLGILKRVVPYGQLAYGLKWAEEWVRLAELSGEDHLWCRVYGSVIHGNKPIKHVNHLNMVLRKYPIGTTEDGENIIVTNHTIRRTYARMQHIGPLNEETDEYDNPMPLRDVAELMGHASVDMTQEHYIGTGWKGIEPQFVYGTDDMYQEIEQLKRKPEYRMSIPKFKGEWLMRIMRRLEASAPHDWFFLYDVIKTDELPRPAKSMCNVACNNLEDQGRVWVFTLKLKGQYQKRVVAKPGNQPSRLERNRGTGQQTNSFKPTDKTRVMIEEWQKENAKNA